jgi:hypothetical protein
MAFITALLSLNRDYSTGNTSLSVAADVLDRWPISEIVANMIGCFLVDFVGNVLPRLLSEVVVS